MAIFGFSFAFPFLSIFINKDLGVHAGQDLYLWTAASASSSGLAMAVASPIWGVLGDRYGRRPMLIRSMLGGAITVGLIFFVQNPAELVVLRLLQGATSGTVAAATSLVAAETPRSRVGWALAWSRRRWLWAARSGPSSADWRPRSSGCASSFCSAESFCSPPCCPSC